jgi:hypothetical protein
MGPPSLGGPIHAPSPLMSSELEVTRAIFPFVLYADRTTPDNSILW